MAAFIDLVVGVIWGSVSGYVGGKVDEYMMRIADILTSLPYLLVVILLLVIMPKSLWTIIFALTITGWINMARIVRGQVMHLKNEENVIIAITLVAYNIRVIWKHYILI